MLSCAASFVTLSNILLFKRIMVPEKALSRPKILRAKWGVTGGNGKKAGGGGFSKYFSLSRDL